MASTKPMLSCILLLCLALGLCTLVSADVYRYKDKNGVWHFTNVQKDTRYTLYIRSKDKKPSQYIEEFEGIITQATQRFNVDPSLVKALIKAESNFDHRAVSRKGAQGLMQLMPPTADAMEVSNPLNPEENIFGGTRYLSLLLKRFGQDKTLAIAAYNAGPEAVEAYGGVPPFAETESFVAKVLDFHKQYAASAK
jgi:soluble lytic murein transglycosylase-like protein